MACRRGLLQFALLLLLAVPVAPLPASPESVALPGCNRTCGGVSIPYPFGVGPNCSREGFLISCNDTQGLPTPYLGNGDMTVMNINLSTGELMANSHVAYACYNATGLISENNPNTKLGETTYLFSNNRNKFTAVGCATFAYVNVSDSYASGCVSICDGLASVAEGSCSGMGCCQASIPEGLDYFNVSFGGFLNHSGVWSFSPCSYAFLVAEGHYHFSKADLSKDFLAKNRDSVPVVVDWAIRSAPSCREAVGRRDYACRHPNSECFSSENGPGYRCKCSEGYEGNPYLHGGCKDINECELQKLYRCQGRCVNLPGGYNCTCPEGTSGDPRTGSCRPKFPLKAKLAIGLNVGSVGPLVITFLVLMQCQKRKLKREKEEFFAKNGGLILLEEMRSEKVETVKVFKEHELEKATNNFDRGKILGQGGCGDVYKGTLEDGRPVAVKKAKVTNVSEQKEEFVNEIIILSQVNHKHVVKLFGCCLEVEVPMLVYEYVPKGSLYKLLHEEKHTPITLSTRLSIAVESAEALAHLHSSVSPAIIHGDVKSRNILIDDDWNAKVADFGASQLLNGDDAQFAAFVRGTFGYLDPEFMQTHRLTEKSDVYSFGVVILELLTRKKAYYEESGDRISLASIIKSSREEHKLKDLVDPRVLGEGGIELFQKIAELVLRCLSISGEDRPTMRDVVEELHSLGRLQRQPSMQHETEETEILGPIESSTKHRTGDSSGHKTEESENLDPLESSTKHQSGDTSGQDSLQAKILLNMDTAR